jgi:hypothetical protein
MRALRIPDSNPGAATSSSSFPNALSPTTTRGNMLADELDESLKGYMYWEQKQKSATANAVLNRQPEAHRLFVPEENSSALGQSHENHLRNQYFDNETWDYHVKGW